MGATNPLLDVSYSGKDLTKAQLQKLEEVKEHITWLSLAETNVEDAWLSIVSNFPNLTRLELEKTTISDNGVVFLPKLKHLEALNLYGTNVTDACMGHIEQISGLKRVYLWETGVSQHTVESLRKNNNELEIILGDR